MKEESKEQTFHSEDVVARLTLWGNIVAWLILAFSLIGFFYDAYTILSSWNQVLASLPSNVLERIAIFISKVFMNPLVGVFYFLVLRGMVQLLNLGMDLFYGTGIEEEEIIEVA